MKVYYDITTDLVGEINSAIFKHGEDQTPLSKLMSIEERYFITTEESLEMLELFVQQILRVTRGMTYDGKERYELRQEMLQLAAMAWATYVGMGEE